MATISIHRAEKIARNINAMDTNYQRIDGGKAFKFWNELNKKLWYILSTLSNCDKNVIKNMFNKKEVEYFGLI